MNPLLLGVLSVLIIGIAFVVIKVRTAKADAAPENREAVQKEEKKIKAQCKEGESVKVVCRSNKKDEYYVLTDQRLIIDGNKGINSIPLDMIERVLFYKMGGEKTRNASDCYYFKVFVFEGKKISLYRNSDKFDKLCEYFMSVYSG